MLVVTSFSPEGYELYGRRCLETFVKHWPCKIVVFYEQKPDFEHEKIEYRDLYSIPLIKQFLDKISTPEFEGILNNQYDYRYNAHKFCRKVFAQDAVFDEDSAVFWLDADSVTLEDVPEEFLEVLIAGVPFTYYGRSKTYTETGFIGFNTVHPNFFGFRQKYLDYFLSGEIFTQLKGWHDCIAFDYARQGIIGRNLSPNGHGMEHVMASGPTAEYWTHLKGPRRKKRAR